MSRTLWNVQARFYAILRANPISACILRKENEALLQLLHSIPHRTFRAVLDVGTGTGNAITVFQQAGLASQHFYAIDSAEEMVSAVRQQFPTVQSLCAQAEHLPFCNHTFDLILCIGVSEYISSLPQLLQELSRVLVPDGFLVITAATSTALNWLRYALLHPLFLRNEPALRIAFRAS